MKLLILFVLAAMQPSIRERMDEALTLARAGDTSTARSIFESIVEDEPRHGPARLQLGRLAVERRDFRAARGHLEIAVVSTPARPALAWYLLGIARAALDDRVGAVQAFEKSVAINPEFVPARMQLGQMATANDDLWTALGHYREVFRLSPSRPDALAAIAAIANVARRMKANALARCAADAAVSHAPENGSLHYLLAVVAEQQGDIEQAITSSERALALGFENAAVYLTLGNLHHERMDLSRSIASFEKGVTLDPQAAESIASFALASLTTTDYETLRGLLERHVTDQEADHEDSVNTLYALGAMYLREGRLEQSRDVFERLVVLAPESSEAQYNLAMTYLRRGRRGDGAAAMARFRELKAREDEAWERGNRRAQRWAELERLQESSSHADAAAAGLELVASGPAEADQLVMLAESLAALGREHEAREIVASALENEPYHRGALDLAAALGDRSASDRLRLLDPKCR